MKKRVGSVEEFHFEPLVCGNSLSVDTLTNQLHITIAVTGWLTNSHKGTINKRSSGSMLSYFIYLKVEVMIAYAVRVFFFFLCVVGDCI